MKKTMSIVLAGMLAVSVLLGGCGDTKTSGDTTSASASESASASVSIADTSTTNANVDPITGAKKYETPVELTFMVAVGAEEKWKDGENPENNAYTRWCKDKFNIVWKHKLSAPNNDELANKLNLLAASSDLPDSVFGQIPQIGMLANSEALMPLDDLIEKNASPLVKWRLKKAQEATDNQFYKPFTLNGKTYAMGIDVDTWGRSGYQTYIRTDLLDELKLQMPKTVEEYEAAMAAYKAKYPKAAGISIWKDLTTDQGYNAISPAMQPYGAYPGRWIKDANGSLTYGSIAPETKKGLETLAKWYKAGYIEKDFITKDMGKAFDTLAAGNSLSVTGDWWFVYWPLNLATPNTKGLSHFMATSLNGPEGKPVTIGPNPFGYATAISAKCKNPEAMIYLWNEGMDSQLRNEQAIRDAAKTEINYEFKYPFEKDLTPTDATAVKELQQRPNIQMEGPEFFKDSNTHPKFYGGFQFIGKVNQILIDNTRIANAYKKQDYSTLLPQDSAGMNQWIKNNVIDALVSEVDLQQKMGADQRLTAFMGAPTKTMIEKKPYLDKLELETFTKIIIGTAPISEFDKFVDNWKKAGGDEVIKEVNEWAAAAK